MHGGKCNGNCNIKICPVRTPENEWLNRNAMYGIMGGREFPSRLPKISVVNLVRFDNIQIKDILKQLKSTERVCMDTDSDLRKFE